MHFKLSLFLRNFNKLELIPYNLDFTLKKFIEKKINDAESVYL